MESGNEIKKVKLPYLINGKTEWICTEKHVWLSEEERNNFIKDCNPGDPYGWEAYWCPLCGGSLEDITNDDEDIDHDDLDKPLIYYCANCGLTENMVKIKESYIESGIKYDGKQIKPIYEPKCPMLDKMRSVKKISQSIGEFLEWLGEQGYVLIEEREVYERPVSMYKDNNATKIITYKEWLPVRKNTEHLLAYFFGIDLDQAEKEKKQLLKSLRI